MADTFYLAMLSAIWLGILTAISPCPLATNIAAVSFISKHIDKTSKSITAGISYALGRSLVYILIAIIIMLSAASTPALSHFLQTKINVILGPILIISGMFLLELISINAGRNINTAYAEKIAKKGTIIGSFAIGMLFALAFCPVSAALYFGSLIPVAIKFNSAVTLPGLYGTGTALPVIAFSILLATSSRYISSVFNKIKIVELWTRKITGIIFILVGIYFTLIFIFKLQFF